MSKGDIVKDRSFFIAHESHLSYPLHLTVEIFEVDSQNKLYHNEA